MRAASKKVAHCTRHQEFSEEECARTRSKSNGQVETERQRQEQEVKKDMSRRVTWKKLNQKVDRINNFKS